MYAQRHRPFDGLDATAKHELNIMRHTRDVYVGCVLRALSNIRWVDSPDECAAVLQLLRQDADTMTRIPRAYRTCAPTRTTTQDANSSSSNNSSVASTPRRRLLRLLSSSAEAAGKVTRANNNSSGRHSGASASRDASPSLHSPRAVSDNHADDKDADAVVPRRLSHLSRDVVYNDSYERALSQRAKSHSAATTPAAFRIPVHQPLPLSAQAALDVRRIAAATQAHTSAPLSTTAAATAASRKSCADDAVGVTTPPRASSTAAVSSTEAPYAQHGRASISDPEPSLRQCSLHRGRAESTLRALFSCCNNNKNSNNNDDDGDDNAAARAELSFLQPPATPARVTAQRRARAAAALRARRLRAVRAAAAAMTHTPNLSRRVARNFTPSCVGKYTHASLSLLYGNTTTAVTA